MLLEKITGLGLTGTQPDAVTAATITKEPGLNPPVSLIDKSVEVGRNKQTTVTIAIAPYSQTHMISL